MSVAVPAYFKQPDVSNPQVTKAVLEVARDGDALSVGALLWGNGKVSAHWVAGYASTEDFLRAEMVKRLALLRCGKPLVAFTKGLTSRLDQFVGGGGYTKEGKQFIAFHLLLALSVARDDGSLRICQPTTLGYGLQAARQVARQALPLAVAEKFTFKVLRQDNPHWHVVVEGSSEVAAQ